MGCYGDTECRSQYFNRMQALLTLPLFSHLSSFFIAYPVNAIHPAIMIKGGRASGHIPNLQSCKLALIRIIFSLVYCRRALIRTDLLPLVINKLDD